VFHLIEEVAAAFNYRDLGPVPGGHIWAQSQDLTGWTSAAFLQDAVIQIRSGRLPRVIIGGSWQNEEALLSQLQSRAEQAYRQLQNPVLAKYGQVIIRPDLSLMVRMTQAQDMTDFRQLLAVALGSRDVQGRPSSLETPLARQPLKETSSGPLLPKGTELIQTPVNDEVVLEIIWTQTGRRQELKTVSVTAAPNIVSQWQRGEFLTPWSQAQIRNGRPVSIVL